MSRTSTEGRAGGSVLLSCCATAQQHVHSTAVDLGVLQPCRHQLPVIVDTAARHAACLFASSESSGVGAHVAHHVMQ